MNPEEPNQTPGQFDPSQYDFITNPETPQKKSLIPSVGGGGKSRMLVIIVASLAVLTVILLLFGLFLNRGSDSKEQMLDIARQQSAIIAVAAIGQEKAGSTDTKSLANSISLTITTDRQAAINHLAKNGTKVKDKDIAGGPSSDITQKLSVAEQNGTFDVAFESVMKELLANYQSEAKAAYNSTTSKSAREIFNETFENSTLLIADAENNK